MDKFDIVKKYIDEMDYYGLLAQGSPEDEFDNESAIIAYQINPDMSPENVAYVISQTFYEAFDGDDQDLGWFIPTAEKILEELKNL